MKEFVRRVCDNDRAFVISPDVEDHSLCEYVEIKESAEEILARQGYEVKRIEDIMLEVQSQLSEAFRLAQLTLCKRLAGPPEDGTIAYLPKFNLEHLRLSLVEIDKAYRTLYM